MKILILSIGKTDASYLQEGEAEYTKRLKHYAPVEQICLAALKKTKGMSQEAIKKAEGDLLLEKLQPDDHIVLLDELGREFSSPKFARFLQSKMNAGHKRLVFVIGGAFGFSQEVYQCSNDQLALSQMTFSHQMVRLFFLEQLYRGFTILNNQKYHH